MVVVGDVDAGGEQAGFADADLPGGTEMNTRLYDGPAADPDRSDSLIRPDALDA